MGTEHDLTRAASAWLKGQPDVWYLKVHGSPTQRRGVPDLIGAVGYRFFALELKAPRGQLTPAQRAEAKRILRATGGGYGVARDLEQVKRFIQCLRG